MRHLYPPKMFEHQRVDCQPALGGMPRSRLLGRRLHDPVELRQHVLHHGLVAFADELGAVDILYRRRQQLRWRRIHDGRLRHVTADVDDFDTTRLRTRKALGEQRPVRLSLLPRRLQMRRGDLGRALLKGAPTGVRISARAVVRGRIVHIVDGAILALETSDARLRLLMRRKANVGFAGRRLGAL